MSSYFGFYYSSQENFRDCVVAFCRIALVSARRINRLNERVEMQQQQRLAIKVPIEGLRRDDKPVEDRAVYSLQTQRPPWVRSLIS